MPFEDNLHISFGFFSQKLLVMSKVKKLKVKLRDATSLAIIEDKAVVCVHNCTYFYEVSTGPSCKLETLPPHRKRLSPQLVAITYRFYAIDLLTVPCFVCFRTVLTK